MQDGCELGTWLGCTEGRHDGCAVGCELGRSDGVADGEIAGIEEGMYEGVPLGLASLGVVEEIVVGVIEWSCTENISSDPWYFSIGSGVG